MSLVRLAVHRIFVNVVLVNIYTLSYLGSTYSPFLHILQLGTKPNFNSYLIQVVNFSISVSTCTV